MSVITTLTPERLVSRARRTLREQAQRPGIGDFERELLAELAEKAWQLECQLEVLEDYQAFQREKDA